MLRLRRPASSESSSTQSKQRPRLGVSLSLCSPKTHKCSLCSRRFSSVQALGGHQNAHRFQRNEMQKMYTQILKNQKQEQNKKPIFCPKAVASAISPPLPNDQEIDLDLRLGCGPSKKTKVVFYEFLPLKEGHGYGALETPNRYDPLTLAHGKSLLFDETELLVRAGANGAHGYGFLEALSVSVGCDEPACELHGGAYTTEVASKETGLDLTLKL